MKKEQNDLGEELCEYCPLDESKRGNVGSPGGYSAGCEGCRCDAAYENYLDEYEENEMEE